MFVIPPLKPDGLRQVAACVHIDLRDRAELKDALEKLEGYWVGLLQQPGEEDVFVRRTVDVDDDAGHFHLEAAVASTFTVTPSADNPLEIVLAEIPGLASGMFGTTAWGRKWVELGLIPLDGTVGTLMGTATVVGDHELTLSGSTLAVSGDGPFTELRWWLTSDDDVIGVEITSWDEMSVDSSILCRVAAITETGVTLLVLEEDIDASDDESSAS